MKHLIMLLIAIVSLCTTSCTQQANRTSRKEKNTPSLLIDDFLKKGSSLKKIKSILGEPDKITTYRDMHEKAREHHSIPKRITFYLYHNKMTQFQEWNFSIDEKGHVVGIAYDPFSNPLLNRVETLPQTWKKYNCKKKRKPDTRISHVIQDYTFFECAKGKIEAYYNMHGEITYIGIDPKKLR